MKFTAIAIALAGSASADPDMLITIDHVAGHEWTITAKFLSPSSWPILQVWTDTSFELSGDGSIITITDYNAVYDTVLGNAFVSNGPVASFVGNVTPFIGSPVDSSNPLSVARFAYSGNANSLALRMVSQNSVIFDQPLGVVDLYQDSNGNPGEYSWDVVVIPAPGAMALAPLALIAARRKR